MHKVRSAAEIVCRKQETMENNYYNKQYKNDQKTQW